MTVLKDSAGIFASAAATSAHLYSQDAPDEVKRFLADLSSGGIDQQTLFENAAEWDAWTEEILCDLIGLVIFGPSFVAALCELLTGLDPSKITFGTDHPPVAWRINLALTGARVLGYDQVLPSAADSMKPQHERFWSYLESFKEADPWFDVFSEAQVRTTLEAIQELVDPYPLAKYKNPSPAILEGLLAQILRQIPPIGFTMTPEGIPRCESVDFRHILYAGWIASKDDGSEDFSLVNRLTEHAVMQQGAIDLVLRGAQL